MARKILVYFRKKDPEGIIIDTSNKRTVRTPLGEAQVISEDQKEKFTGDLGGNLIEIVPEDLTIENVLKRVPTQELRFQFQVADQNFACPIYLSGSEDNNLQFVTYTAPPGFQNPYPIAFQFVGRKRFIFGKDSGSASFSYSLQNEIENDDFDVTKLVITSSQYTDTGSDWVTSGSNPSGGVFEITASEWTGGSGLVRPRAVELEVFHKYTDPASNEIITTSDTVVVEQDRFVSNVKIEANEFAWNETTGSVRGSLDDSKNTSPFRSMVLMTEEISFGYDNGTSIPDLAPSSDPTGSWLDKSSLQISGIEENQPNETFLLNFTLSENDVARKRVIQIPTRVHNENGFQTEQFRIIQGRNLRIEAQYETDSNVAYVASGSGSQLLTFYVTGSSFDASPANVTFTEEASWLRIGIPGLSKIGNVATVSVNASYDAYDTFTGSGIAIPREAEIQFETTPPITVGDNPFRLCFQQEVKPPTVLTRSDFFPKDAITQPGLGTDGGGRNVPTVGLETATLEISFKLKPTGGVFRTFSIQRRSILGGLPWTNVTTQLFSGSSGENGMPRTPKGYYDTGRIRFTYTPPSSPGGHTRAVQRRELVKVTLQSAFGSTVNPSSSQEYNLRLEFTRSPNSLVSGTKVATQYVNADTYSTKNIEDLLVSDTIVSKQIPTLPDTDDSETLTSWTNSTLGDNTLATTAVETISSSEDDTIININNGLLKLTTNHLVFVLRNEIWALLRAKDVKNNDLLRHIDGHNIKVTSVETETYTGTVYRIDVEELDVFYANGILIHNG